MNNYFFTHMVDMASHYALFQLVLIAIVADIIFGILRAIKEKDFNSCIGIDGMIRKTGMILSIIALIFVDAILKVDLIGFVPDEILNIVGVEFVGFGGLFALIYLAYEIVSVIKNMALCGLPVKALWIKVRELLGKYTSELPDADGLEEKK